MKIALFALGTVFALSIMGCNKAPVPVVSTTPSEVMGLLRNDFAVLLDVRESAQVQGGRAAQAKSIPLSKIESGAAEWRDWLQSVPKDKQVVIYGVDRAQAESAAKKAAEQGYRSATLDSYQDWIKAGLPTQSN